MKRIKKIQSFYFSIPILAYLFEMPPLGIYPPNKNKFRYMIDLILKMSRSIFFWII